MNPDRLEELRRQRALLQEQLARLEGEIQTDKPPPPEGSAAARSPATSGLAPSTPDIDNLFAEFKAEEGKQKPPAKTGCWVLFVTLLVIAVGGIVLLARLLYR